MPTAPHVLIPVLSKPTPRLVILSVDLEISVHSGSSFDSFPFLLHCDELSVLRKETSARLGGGGQWSREKNPKPDP